MTKDLLSKLSFVDVETTGTSAMHDRVIDIGIVRVEDGKIVEEFESLVNPQTSLSPYIAQMTSITPEMLYRAPLFEEIKSKVYDLLDGTVFVAHNAQFDYAFIKQEFERLETRFSRKMLCTVRLSRLLYPEYSHHNLDAIIERFEIEVGKRHRAFPDAKALYFFLEKIKGVVEQKRIDDAVKVLTRRSRLPSNIDKEKVKQIPNFPGVYIFYDKTGTVLYIGKSTRLKDRVMNHFSSFHSNTTDLKLISTTTDVEVIRCGGDLSASLLEAELIKKMQPIFNRKLRGAKEVVAVIKNDSGKYHSVEIKKISIPIKKGYEKILTIYPSMKKAKDELWEICKVTGLCPRLMGLEKGKGACFNYQIGKCKGACVGKISPAKYNTLLIETFGSYFVPRWPFEGTIGVKEQSDGMTEVTFIDNWMHVGKSKSSNGDAPVYEKKGEGINTDTVKILKKFLKKRYYQQMIETDGLEKYLDDES